ncbi:phosphoenolpyruvate--protein phosphotransferase, partial [Propionibacterium freudenreichii]|nr:phosphoenolpyruvate--protein phosphotransferase [Propionibacterium freudenreichii]
MATAVVEGPVHIIDPDPDVAGYRAGSAAIEQARFDQARHHVAGYLDDQASGPFAAIFNAQKALLNDASLRTGVSSAIDKGASSIEAVSATMAGLSASFDKLSDPYLRERGQDVRSLDRLLRSAIVGASLRWPREAPAGVWVLPELDALS